MRELVDALMLRGARALDRLWPAPVDERPQIERPVGARVEGARIAERYVLERVLGEGAFGRVWRAQDEELQRPVAIKELLPGAEGAGSLEQLEQEFYSLSKLRHPNIVGVFDYGEFSDGTRYLVLEYVEGEDIYERLERGPIPREDAFRSLIDLAAALQLLHSRLFVHCDIKAENVRVPPSGGAKLMDFGLLQQLGLPATSIKGTPQYMAPELIEGRVVDARTDLYALGVLAYEMFTGNLPFEGATPRELFHHHLHTQAREPSYFLDLPPEVDALVLSLLAKNPDDRPGDAGAVLKTLGELSGVDTSALAVAQRTSYLYAAEVIGFDAQTADLKAAREELQAGVGGARFIAGAPGTGKTRLLEEARLGLKLDRVTVAEAACRKEDKVPLAPLLRALTPLLANTDDEVLRSTGPVLAHLFAELKARGFSPAPFASPTQAEFKKNEALVEWLRGLAAQSPLALILEDLHFADSATVRVFNHLIRGLQGSPVLFLGASRADRSSPIYATVTEGLSRVLETPPLDRDGLDALLRATLRRHALEDAFVDTLYEAAGGNPFFTIESLRLLVESEQLDDDDGWRVRGDPALPDSVTALVGARASLLPDELAALSRDLAPAGRAVDMNLAQHLTKLSRAELTQRLEDLVARQFLARDRGRFFFVNEAVRDGVYEATPEETRAELHRQIAAALIKGVAESAPDPGLLAFHFKRGGEADRAIDAFLSAARSAARDQQLLEATGLLEEGVELLESSQRRDREALLATFYDLMATTSIGTKPPACVRAVERLDEIWAFVDLDDAFAKVKAAGPPKGPPPPFDPKTREPVPIFHRLEQLHGMQAMAYAILGRPDRALEVVERARQLIASPRSPAYAASAIPQVLALFHMGRFEEQRAAAREAMAVFGAMGERVPPPLRIFWFLATYLYSLSEALEGRVLDAEIEATARRIPEMFDLPQERAFAELPTLVRGLHTGRPEVVRPAAEVIGDLSQRLGYPHALFSRYRLWFPAYQLDRGERDEAAATIGQLEGIAQRTRDVWVALYVDIYRGLEAVEDGRLGDALALLEAAAQNARERQLGRLTLALSILGDVQRRLGDLDGARASLEEALARATDAATRSLLDETVARRLLAELELDEGEDDAAEAHLKRALELADEGDNPLERGKALLTLANLRAQTGAPADDLVERAEAAFADLDNARWLARARAMRG